MNYVSIKHLDSILHAMRASVGFSLMPSTLDALRNEIVSDIKRAYADGRGAATPAEQVTQDEATSRCMGARAEGGCHGNELWPD